MSACLRRVLGKRPSHSIRLHCPTTATTSSATPAVVAGSCWSRPACRLAPDLVPALVGGPRFRLHRSWADDLGLPALSARQAPSVSLPRPLSALARRLDRGDGAGCDWRLPARRSDLAPRRLGDSRCRVVPGQRGLSPRAHAVTSGVGSGRSPTTMRDRCGTATRPVPRHGVSACRPASCAAGR
jgi:hypothetical protein